MNVDTDLIGLMQRVRTRAQQYRFALRSVKTDPLTARHWHDATDPHQAARIEAAAAKRARKADNAQHYSIRSDVFNTVHRKCANFVSLTSTI